MSINLVKAIQHARAGRLRLDLCGELLQRKFARDFAAGVAFCFAEFRQRDDRLNDALECSRNWLRGVADDNDLQAAYRSVLQTQDDAFRTGGAMAAIMRVVEVFASTRRTFRQFYLRISAAKAIRTTAEALAPRQSFDADRAADEARQAACVYAFYRRPNLATRHLRRSHEFVPPVFQAIRSNELRRQREHVVENLQWLRSPAAVDLLGAHERGDTAARAIFWDWCEEQGFDLCPTINETFDPASLKRLEELD